MPSRSVKVHLVGPVLGRVCSSVSVVTLRSAPAPRGVRLYVGLNAHSECRQVPASADKCRQVPTSVGRCRQGLPWDGRRYGEAKLRLEAESALSMEVHARQQAEQQLDSEDACDGCTRSAVASPEHAHGERVYSVSFTALACTRGARSAAFGRPSGSHSPGHCFAPGCFDLFIVAATRSSGGPRQLQRWPADCSELPATVRPETG